MPRKPTLAELTEENARLRAETSLQHMALLFLGGGIEPDATERFTATEHDYTDRVSVYLYGAARSSGGIVVEVQRDLARLPTVRTFTADDYFVHCARHAAHVPSAFNIARRDTADKIRVARDAAVRATYQPTTEPTK